MALQGFTKNHRDHSNDNGFQFEFCCDKCGNGFRSEFKTNTLGMAASVLKAAGSIFGGSVRSAGWGADHVKDAFRGPAWDDAFKEAIEQCKPRFRQCTQCGQWVCPEVCFNHARGLCEGCAPDLGEHAAMIQAQVAVDQARQQAQQSDQLRGLDMQGQVHAVGAPCSKCGAMLGANAKFCAQCGTSAPVVAAAGPKFCSQCGGGLGAGAKFCAQCGTPTT